MLWLGKFLPASRKLADYEVLFEIDFFVYRKLYTSIFIGVFFNFINMFFMHT